MTRADSPLRVVVVGQGYVGLPLALRSVEVGFDVVGLDTDDLKTRALAAGRSPIEGVNDRDLVAALATGRYCPTADAVALEGFDVAVITVPTPLRNGVPDMVFIERALEMIGRFVSVGSTVVLESTTYPGTTEVLVVDRLEAASGLKAGVDFHVGYSPERIDPGNVEWDLVRTPKLVSGITDGSLDAVRAFYDRLVDRTVVTSTPSIAEFAKLLENTFRHVNIALVNELAVQAHALGIDIWEAIDAADTKPFGFMPFRPGPGVGGHCLPIDPSYLSWAIEQQLGANSRFIDTANDVNRRMPLYIVQRIQHGLNERGLAVNGSRIVVLGIAYKRNSSDTRESPAITVIERLVELGAEVRVVDRHVGVHAIDLVTLRCEPTDDEAAQADVVVILTDHDGVDYEQVAACASYVFDTRNRVRASSVEQL